MARKCSHCGNIGHNSRTCNTTTSSRGPAAAAAITAVRLFGVHLDVPSSSSSSSSSSASINPMKKSFSLDCLMSSSPALSSSSSSRVPPISEYPDHKAALGYLSDGSPSERKKGVAWTEEEHRRFLLGLEKLGKGDWRGISRNYVTSRTPTQVASHAQKYFLRQASISNKRRRSSLFDMYMVGDNGSGSGSASRREVCSDLNSFGEDEEKQEVVWDHELELTLSAPANTNIHLLIPS